ncbi:MAG: NAD(P)H-binding protein [Microlunatus sp.]|nr:NAD(P)H-binding protein [Microlunatus sp.]
MSKIVIIGGTGYTGSNLAREAVWRGHTVTSWSRNQPKEPVDGVSYRTGDAPEAVQIIDGADAVIAALSPRGDLEGRLFGLYQEYAAAAARTGARFIAIGGFSSLRPAPGRPRFAEGDVPEQFRAEALEMEAVRNWICTEAPQDLDWLFISPAGAYGVWAAGERTGAYRLGGEIALFTADGKSEISGPDFALAIMDAIDGGEHHREHLSVAY